MIKKCEWCGNGFDTSYKVQKYCCEDCSKRAKNERCKEYHRRKSDEKPKTILKCQICGAEFVSKWGAVVCSNPCRKEYQRRVAHDYYEQHYQPKMRKCVVCGKEFVVKHNFKVCSTECRTVRDKQKAKEFYQKYKPKALKRKAEQRARFKAEEPPVDYRHLKLDGKVLDKAQMTVDEYNRIHGTKYSYGQYVHYVESKGVK